jgi:hypothetical protein
LSSQWAMTLSPMLILPWHASLLSLAWFLVQSQSTPRKSTPVAVYSTVASSCRFRRRNAICHHL